MNSSARFVEFVQEQLAELPGVFAIRMFGGYGLKVGEVNFGLILSDTLYLCTDDALAEKLKAAGGEAFSFTRSGKLVTTKYVSVCADDLEEPEQVTALAREALAAARAAKTAKRPSTPKAKRRVSP